jgi:hypothetical protein
MSDKKEYKLASKLWIVSSRFVCKIDQHFEILKKREIHKGKQAKHFLGWPPKSN